MLQRCKDWSHRKLLQVTPFVNNNIISLLPYPADSIFRKAMAKCGLKEEVVIPYNSFSLKVKLAQQMFYYIWLFRERNPSMGFLTTKELSSCQQSFDPGASTFPPKWKKNLPGHLFVLESVQCWQVKRGEVLLGAETQRPHSCGQKDEQQAEKLSQFRPLKDLVSDAWDPVILAAAAVDQRLSFSFPAKLQIRLTDPLEKGSGRKRQKGNKNSDSFKKRIHILAAVAPLETGF